MAALKTALIVDDIAFARRVLKDVLTQGKYSVVAEASNGKEAIQAYKQYKPDVVIMDVVMPLMGGIEATRKIVEEHKDAKIIMISGLTHDQLLMEAINSGARDYIVKPFSASDILMAIEKALHETDEIGHYSASAKSAKGASYGR